MPDMVLGCSDTGVGTINKDSTFKGFILQRRRKRKPVKCGLVFVHKVSETYREK